MKNFIYITLTSVLFSCSSNLVPDEKEQKSVASSNDGVNFENKFLGVTATIDTSFWISKADLRTTPFSAVHLDLTHIYDPYNKITITLESEKRNPFSTDDTPGQRIKDVLYYSKLFQEKENFVDSPLKKIKIGKNEFVGLRSQYLNESAPEVTEYYVLFKDSYAFEFMINYVDLKDSVYVQKIFESLK